MNVRLILYTFTGSIYAELCVDREWYKVTTRIHKFLRIVTFAYYIWDFGYRSDIGRVGEKVSFKSTPIHERINTIIGNRLDVAV